MFGYELFHCFRRGASMVFCPSRHIFFLSLKHTHKGLRYVSASAYTVQCWRSVQHKRHRKKVYCCGSFCMMRGCAVLSKPVPWMLSSMSWKMLYEYFNLFFILWLIISPLCHPMIHINHIRYSC